MKIKLIVIGEIIKYPISSMQGEVVGPDRHFCERRDSIIVKAVGECHMLKIVIGSEIPTLLLRPTNPSLIMLDYHS